MPMTIASQLNAHTPLPFFFFLILQLDPQTLFLLTGLELKSANRGPWGKVVDLNEGEETILPLSLSLSLFFFFPFLHGSKPTEGFLVTQLVKNLPTVQEIRVQSLGLEDRLEKEMATHFSILAWKIPWTEEPGGLQTMGSERVGHD